MFGRSQELYDAVYDAVGKDYQAEARAVLERVAELRGSEPASVLDVACGTGRHLEHFVRTVPPTRPPDPRHGSAPPNRREEPIATHIPGCGRDPGPGSEPAQPPPGSRTATKPPTYFGAVVKERRFAERDTRCERGHRTGRGGSRCGGSRCGGGGRAQCQLAWRSPSTVASVME